MVTVALGLLVGSQVRAGRADTSRLQYQTPIITIESTGMGCRFSVKFHSFTTKGFWFTTLQEGARFGTNDQGVFFSDFRHYMEDDMVVPWSKLLDGMKMDAPFQGSSKRAYICSLAFNSEEEGVRCLKAGWTTRDPRPRKLEPVSSGGAMMYFETSTAREEWAKRFNQERVKIGLPALQWR